MTKRASPTDDVLLDNSITVHEFLKAVYVMYFLFEQKNYTKHLALSQHQWMTLQVF